MGILMPSLVRFPTRTGKRYRMPSFWATKRRTDAIQRRLQAAFARDPGLDNIPFFQALEDILPADTVALASEYLFITAGRKVVAAEQMEMLQALAIADLLVEQGLVADDLVTAEEMQAAIEKQSSGLETRYAVELDDDHRNHNPDSRVASEDETDAPMSKREVLRCCYCADVIMGNPYAELSEAHRRTLNEALSLDQNLEQFDDPQSFDAQGLIVVCGNCIGREIPELQISPEELEYYVQKLNRKVNQLLGEDDLASDSMPSPKEPPELSYEAVGKIANQAFAGDPSLKKSLPRDKVEECKRALWAQLSQPDATASRKIYAELLQSISNPMAVMRGRNCIEGMHALHRWLNFVIFSQRALWVIAAALGGIAFGLKSLELAVASVAIAAFNWLGMQNIQTRLNVEIAARLFTFDTLTLASEEQQAEIWASMSQKD